MKVPMPTFLRADARRLPLADESVDLVVTSPPYFGLRSYIDGGEHYEAQLGSEATPTEFLNALIACTAEMVRVLKSSGSIWLNLGDKYSGAQAQNYNGASNRRSVDSGVFWRQADPKRTGIPNKSLMMFPERFRIRAVDELGLIARAVVIWSKPNGLPESVQDRVRRSHEDWVHLTKMPRYFSAVDEIREPLIDTSAHAANRRSRGDARLDSAGAGRTSAANPLGKLPGSVWEVPTQPLNVPSELGVDHFAAFPMEWPRRIIRGWCPSEVCTACGEGRRPVIEAATTGRDNNDDPVYRRRSTVALRGDDYRRFRAENPRTIAGSMCACPDVEAPSTPGVVLDPFSGTGTTALVATMLGRRGIGVDLSADYCRLAQWRSQDPKERARAAGLDPDAVAAIKPEVPGQAALFGESA